MVTRRFVLGALPAVAVYPRLWSQKDRAVPPDAELTRNLLTAPGPTFRIEEKAVSRHWTLIAYGDMRFTDPTNDKVTDPKVRRWLVERIGVEHPDALLLSGDVPYDGSVTNDYSVYHQETSAWREKKLRVYPALGNHELHGDEIREPKNWWQAFPELKGRRWYSVEMGNAYILSLDSNLSLLESSRQHQWLEDQLDHIPATTQFVFVSLHHPPVADSIENNNSHDVRPNELALAQLLEKRAAVSPAKFIVIAGHIHNYQRFLERGVIYLVSGGGGAKPHPIARTAADQYQDAGFPNYHYLKFTCNGNGLSAEMYRLQNPEGNSPVWEIKDRFVVSAHE